MATKYWFLEISLNNVVLIILHLKAITTKMTFCSEFFHIYQHFAKHKVLAFLRVYTNFNYLAQLHNDASTSVEGCQNYFPWVINLWDFVTAFEKIFREQGDLGDVVAINLIIIYLEAAKL